MPVKRGNQIFTFHSGRLCNLGPLKSDKSCVCWSINYKRCSCEKMRFFFVTTKPGLLSRSSPGPVFRGDWPWKRPASGWGSFWESSSFVPWLFPNALRVGSGVAPEYPGNNGFIRKSSSRASAPRMRLSVLLNSFDSLFVTLPSISSETWVM